MTADTFVVHYREDDCADGTPGPFKASSKAFGSRAEAERYAESIHPRRDAFIVNATPEAAPAKDWCLKCGAPKPEGAQGWTYQDRTMCPSCWSAYIG